MAEWRDVLGYEGKYQISNTGIVKGVKTLKTRVLNNYEWVKLRKPGESPKGFYIHRLVAEAFIHKIPKGKEINHIDGNKLNNNLSNLEIVTHKENCVHRSEVLDIHVCKRTPVKNLDTGECFKSASAAARSVGRTVQALFYAIEHHTRCGGYRFERNNYGETERL